MCGEGDWEHALKSNSTTENKKIDQFPFGQRRSCFHMTIVGTVTHAVLYNASSIQNFLHELSLTVVFTDNNNCFTAGNMHIPKDGEIFVRKPLAVA